MTTDSKHAWEQHSPFEEPRTRTAPKADGRSAWAAEWDSAAVGRILGV
jgi:hypothetical protein